MLKRIFDLIVASVLLIVLSPLLLTVALALKVQAQTPVFNLSPRVGKDGRIFKLIRFRTMIDAPGLTSEQRLTKVGAGIRRYSIDDMINLINVVKGDLSLVGPRPTEPERVDLSNPEWQLILAVRPGWVSYAILMLATHYNDSDPALKRRLELEYVEQHSLRRDLQLMLDAVRGWFTSKGNVKERGMPRVDG